MKQDATGHALMQTTPRPAQVFERGQGTWLFDDQGVRYLDWVQGWAVNGLGHCPYEVTQAIARQMQQVMNVGPAYFNAPAIELAELLVAHSCFDQVFLASSGAEANEAAIKLARKWGQVNKRGAFEIISFKDAFHGRTLATMAASGKSGWESLFTPVMPGFRKAEYNNPQSVLDLIGPDTVAVMLEPVQGEAGVIPAHAEFMQGLRRLCNEHHLLLIVDEVQTGCGRTGTLFAYQDYGIEPDIMSLGKGIGGGVPLSALLARQHVCCFAYGEQGGTYCGNPLMAAAGVAVLETLLKTDFLQTVRVRGQQLQAGLQALSVRHALGGVRGKGMLQALLLPAENGTHIAASAYASGFLINSPRPGVLRFMPPLNSTQGEIEEGLQRLDQIFADAC
jgi:acetylornithine/N-succinyldiaminopimelate aminotransferase